MNDPAFSGTFECGDYAMSFFAHCLHSVAVAVGGASFDYPSEAGFPIGPSYENLALLEVHFDNSAGENFQI